MVPRIGVREIQKAFFDRTAVTSRVSKATRWVLSRYGSFVRRKAKDLLRSKKGSSPPGEPPHSHGPGHTLRRFLFFSYDGSQESVVIGPALTNQLSVNSSGGFVKGTVPEVLEEGGTVGIFEVYKWGRWRRADLRSRRRNADLPSRVRRVNIAKRPYMSKADRIERPKLPGLWRNSVRV